MIRIDHVTFSYGEENENAGGVHDINLTVEDGQCVVLCGESGSGKTTITRLINGLIPHYYEGKMNGEVWVNGAKVSEQPLYDTAKTVGSVFQNPRSQFFNVDTTSEITFGCENLGQPEQSIRERLDKTIRDFHLEKLMGRNIFHLSGGEKQKIACAGVSIMEPDVLVMDEPSSNLDASSILDLRAILAFWKSQGKTIIVSEHRLYYLRGLADRFIYITGGKVEKDYSAAEFESLTEQQRARLGLRTFILEDLLPPKALPKAGQQMELRNFCFAYKNEPETLHIRESKIPANRIVGIIGNNGAGKSTFSRCFCGLEKRCGEVIWNGRTYRPKDRLNTCYMVMQEVNHQLFTETVLDEVLISMEEENQEWAEEILAELDLIGFKDRHPMSLSGGQKQRVAIASAIASKRSILFFDEPTSGLDYKHMKEVANVLKQVRDSLNVHLGQPQPSAPSLLAHQSTHGSSLTALFWQTEGTKGKAAAYRWRLAHLQADRDSSGNLKINSRLCKKRAEPQKKDSSPLFRSLERALEKRGSDLRVPAASILFPYALFVSFVPALLSVP